MTVIFDKGEEWVQCDYKSCDELHDTILTNTEWLMWQDKISGLALHLCESCRINVGGRVRLGNQMEKYLKPSVMEKIEEHRFMTANRGRYVDPDDADFRLGRFVDDGNDIGPAGAAFTVKPGSFTSAQNQSDKIEAMKYALQAAVSMTPPKLYISDIS